jgi:NADPH2:quinone reductase
MDQPGPASVLNVVDVSLPPPGAGEVHLKQTAIGLNFIDIYQRSGLYTVPLPGSIGMEAAGVVLAVGAGVSAIAQGDRVAYCGGAPGAYAAERLVPAAQLVRLPEGVSEEAAAALMLKGMTAFFLLHLTYPVQRGQRVLVHAAAGGVGSVLIPWAKHLGAWVVGTAGGPEKCALAKSFGCDEVIDYRSEDFVAVVKRLTGGKRMDVVYDSVGRDTLMKSLDCLKRRGYCVAYGNASGPPDAIEPALLGAKGSLFLTRPRLFDYIATREELETAAAALFEAMRAGVVRADIRQRYPLREARRAHEELEGRRTTGMSVLLP